MEKMIWAKPEMNEVAFAANEYVAACVDTTSTFWKFVCDFGGGASMDIWKGVWDPNKSVDENKANSELLTEDSWFIVTIPGAYHACGEEHYIDASQNKDDIFFQGWADSNYDDDVTNYAGNVTIWRGPNNDNVHASSALKENITVVEGNKS